MTSSRAPLVLAACGWLSWLAVTTAQTPAGGAAIPNIAGKILTVNGPIEPAQLGRTLMHEHIFIDFYNPDDEPERWRLSGRTKPVGATDVAFYRAPLTMDILSAVALGKPNKDNWTLSDEKLAITEVNEFKRAGGGTIVDVTSIGLNRRPEALRRVSRATGLNVVMGASWYTKGFHPRDMDSRTVEQLTDEIVRDVTIGVDDTGIRSGIIGEVGVSGGGTGLNPNEVKVVRAAARASRITGAAISLHLLPAVEERSKVIDMLAEEGADLSRVIVGHSDPMANDIPYLTAMLKRGVYIQFDVLGRPPLITRRRPTDVEVAATIMELIKAGHGDKILLSQDICTKTSLKAYGGTGYSYIEEMLIPYLKRQKVTDAQIDAMVVENPKRVLTFAAPQAARTTTSQR